MFLAPGKAGPGNKFLVSAEDGNQSVCGVAGFCSSLEQAQVRLDRGHTQSREGLEVERICPGFDEFTDRCLGHSRGRVVAKSAFAKDAS